MLPEEFLWGGSSSPIPADCDMSPGQNCSVINALGVLAKKHSMYIVFGMRAPAPAGDPYRPDPARDSGRRLGYNTDVILGRDGEMVGYYRKAWPCCPGPDGTSMDDGYPSRELVKTFDLDFGRVGLQTCFDMNFDDTWHQLYAQHTDIVFWPSAYGGGMPMRAYEAPGAISEPYLNHICLIEEAPRPSVDSTARHRGIALHRIAVQRGVALHRVSL